MDKISENSNFSHLEVILRKMCYFVNAKYEDIDFKSPNWYLSHTWTEEEEERFGNWLITYLRDNKDARLEIMRYGHGSLRNIKKAVSEFIFIYGWKLE